MDVLSRDKDGKPQVIVGVDQSEPDRATNVRLDMNGMTFFLAPANARTLADALHKHADALDASHIH